MELRLLHYFLTIAKEESILQASKVLNITQPTLSRQIKELEDQLGYSLFIRGNRKITLTEEALFLKKRAEEILELVLKTEDELANLKNNLSGNIYIGCGETEGMTVILQAIKKMQEEYPLVKFHIQSGDRNDIVEKLDNGTLDFALLVESKELHKYEHLSLKHQDTWGLLTRKDDPIANKPYIEPKDLVNLPLILTRQISSMDLISQWLKKDITSCQIVATYNLIYNASLMAKEKIGHVVCLDRLVSTSEDSELTFIPFYPTLTSSLAFVYKKHETNNDVSRKFLQLVKETLKNL